MDDSQLARVNQWLMELLAIPGKSCEENAVADYVTRRLLESGAEAEWIQRDTAHRRSPFGGETGNLILRLPGTRRGARRLFSAHLDTVPLCVGSVPQQHGRMVQSADPATGLGADNRAGVAVLLAAAKALLAGTAAHPPLTFCWFVQEEIGLQGARHVSKRLLGNPRLGFNWDGGSPFKLTIGATGGYRMRIDVTGLASHAGGAPEHGVSAITIASLAIADLHENGWLGDVRKGRRCGTSNVGVIQGGAATNVVTDHVELLAEARSHQPTFRERIVREIERAFGRAVKQVKNVAGRRGGVTFDGRLDYEAYCLETDEPCVKMAQQAAAELDAESILTVANGGLDANWTNRHGIPTVSMGCGQRNQHTVNEQLDLDEFEHACRLAFRLATAAA